MSEIWKQFGNWPLFRQLFVVLVLISVIPLAISGILVFQSADQGFRNETLEAASQHAAEWGHSSDAMLEDRINEIESIGMTPGVYDACVTGASWNITELYASYEGTKQGSAGEDELPEKSALPWDPSNDPNPEASQYLEDYCDLNNEFLEIFVTDNRGWNVVTMSSTPGDFDQYGEDWYVSTLLTGSYTEYEYDESSAATVYSICVDLKKDGKTYGVIKAALYFREILADLEEAEFYGSGFGLVIEKTAFSVISTKEASLIGTALEDYMSEGDYNRLTGEVSDHEVTDAFRGKFEGKSYFIGYHSCDESDFMTVILVPASLYSNYTNNVLLTVLIIGAVATFLAMGVAFVVAKSLANPIGIMAETSEKLATGDLTVDIKEYNRTNEIGKLGTAFKEMVSYLKSSIQQISGVTDQLATSAQEMASSAEEVNAASEEISSITQQMAKGSQQQSAQVTMSLEQAESLKVQFDEKVKSIEGVSELISGITGQVNMLALNASIEAARAGEYGRGFAVVADNVRKLAEEAKDSVEQVSSIVTDLRESIEKAIDHIVGSINTVASISEETAAGSEEASSATEEQAATMEEMSASAQELAKMADELDAITKKFKV